MKPAPAQLACASVFDVDVSCETRTSTTSCEQTQLINSAGDLQHSRFRFATLGPHLPHAPNLMENPCTNEYQGRVISQSSTAQHLHSDSSFKSTSATATDD